MEDYLDDLRKIYIRTHVPKNLKENGWNELRVRMAVDSMQAKRNYLAYFQKGLAFASLLLVFLFGSTLGIAQATKPGDTLYSVKLLTEDIITKTTGNYEMKIQRRADEILQISESDPEQFEKAAKLYQDTLDSSKKEYEKNGKSEELNATLQQQQDKFNQIITKNPALKSKLQGVIDQTKKAQSEVKGVRSSNTSNSDTDKIPESTRRPQPIDIPSR